MLSLDRAFTPSFSGNFLSAIYCVAEQSRRSHIARIRMMFCSATKTSRTDSLSFT